MYATNERMYVQSFNIDLIWGSKCFQNVHIRRQNVGGDIYVRIEPHLPHMFVGEFSVERIQTHMCSTKNKKQKISKSFSDVETLL